MVSKKGTLVQIQQNFRVECLRHTFASEEQEFDGIPTEDEKITYLIDVPFDLALLVDREQRPRETFLGKSALEASFLSIEGPVAKMYLHVGTLTEHGQK